MSRKLVGGSFFVLALVVLLSGLGQPAKAFQPASQNETYEILLPQFDINGYQSPARDAGSLEVTRALETRYGGSWRVHSWNSQTDTPHFVYGSSVPVSGPITSAADLEQAARQVITANTDVLRADLDNLRLTATPNALGKWVAHFQQTYYGLDVWEATVRIVMTEDGRLMLMGSDYHTGIDVNPTPTLPEGVAIDIAKSDLPFDPTTDSIEDGATLLVLPYPISETEVEYRLVWRVRVDTADPVGIWVTHVDAQTGEILWRYNDVHFAYGGTTDTEVQIYGYCDGSTQMTVPYLRVSVSGLGNTTSDENGDWTINGTGGPRTVTADLYGPYVDINNQGGGEATFTGTADEDVPLTVLFDDANAQRDERDVFDAVNDIHDFFEAFDPGFGYANQRITANVSINSSCNAYWNGTINFYREGGGCANTGEMQQVVDHEFGHGVQDAILGWQGNQGLGEGNGDILGNLITQDPIIGRGFYLNNCTSGIRNSLNNLQYPDDVVGQEIHYAGQVIAGFNWDNMVLFQNQYGVQQGTVMSAERWHFGRVLMHPTNQPDQVLSAFIADDDNGDLDDGTPHHDILCEAAENHGFECPEVLIGVFVYHDAYPYTGDRTEGYDIVGTVLSLPAGEGEILPETVTLHYRVDGGIFDEITMTATGNPDEYAAMIPAQPWGSVVEYYLSAWNDLGSYGTSPRNAPDELHYFEVGEEFSDEMETDTAWSSGAPDDDAASGLWERVDPIGTTYNGNQVQPEDDHTVLGTDCWITGQHQAGQGAGYNDVDNGKTTLLSPRFDLTGAQEVIVSYWRWYTNDAGNNPGEDWWDVDVSNDGGETWTAVEHTQASAAEWTQVELDLMVDYFPEPDLVQFRFVASDPAGSGSLVEAGVDDFLLAAVFDVTGADDGIGVRFLTGLQQNNPNPFNPVTEIRFTLEKAGPATLKVYDASGRQVASLAEGDLPVGEHRVIWNGTDDDGRPLATGTYFYRLEANGRVLSARMVLLK